MRAENRKLHGQDSWRFRLGLASANRSDDPVRLPGGTSAAPTADGGVTPPRASGSGGTSAGKSVSGLYDITSIVCCDHNDDLTYGNDGDHLCAGHPVVYTIGDDWQEHFVYCSQSGQHTIVRNDEEETDAVWIGPYLTHFAHYWKISGGLIVKGTEDVPQDAPAGQAVSLSFCGSDWEP